jgi:hypothetical protein
MVTNKARDLFLLAALSFKNGRIKSAGELFAASLSSDDSDAFLQIVNDLDVENKTVTSSDKKRQTLGQIARELAVSMSSNSDADDDAEDVIEEGGDESLEENSDDSTDEGNGDDTEIETETDDADSFDEEALSSCPVKFKARSPVRAK